MVTCINSLTTSHGIIKAAIMSRLSGIDLTAINCKVNTVREYLSVLVLPINEKTVSVDLLVYFSVLYTLNSLPF